MQNQKEGKKKRQNPRIPAYLTQYESYDSTSTLKKSYKYQSVNIKRRLKQLCNKQKYLTDDQHQSCKESKGSLHVQDSSMDYEVEESINQSDKIKISNFLRRTHQRSHQIRKHQRVISSSDQQLRVPQKMKRTQDSKQEAKAKQIANMKERIEELASISSAFQEQSLQMKSS